MGEWKTQANLEAGQFSGTEKLLPPGEQYVGASIAISGKAQALEPLLDCAGAAAVLGGVPPKTVERWAREGRIPAYHYFRHWKFRASELEIWIHSHVNSVCHPCRLTQEESDGA